MQPHVKVASTSPNWKILLVIFLIILFKIAFLFLFVLVVLVVLVVFAQRGQRPALRPLALRPHEGAAAPHGEAGGRIRREAGEQPAAGGPAEGHREDRRREPFRVEGLLVEVHCLKHKSPQRVRAHVVPRRQLRQLRHAPQAAQPLQPLKRRRPRPLRGRRPRGVGTAEGRLPLIDKERSQVLDRDGSLPSDDVEEISVQALHADGDGQVHRVLGH
mmetsp:Transcript_4608/g.11442  ORF Transcript_4608/g.11442 Transcript_4608/m.11442 type:complete len:216 (-) Transcript_4608:888-1535(-)